MLLKIGINFLREDDKEKYLYFLKKGLKDEYFLTMYLLGEYFENLHKLYPPVHAYDENYLNDAIKYYQKALDNGYNKAAKKLCDIYTIKEDNSKIDKYYKFEFFTRNSQINNNE